jgi:hypothetical protein
VPCCQKQFELSREKISLPSSAAADVASFVQRWCLQNLVDYLQLFSPIMRCIQTASASAAYSKGAVEMNLLAALLPRVRSHTAMLEKA